MGNQGTVEITGKDIAKEKFETKCRYSNHDEILQYLMISIVHSLYGRTAAIIHQFQIIGCQQ